MWHVTSCTRPVRPSTRPQGLIGAQCAVQGPDPRPDTLQTDPSQPIPSIRLCPSWGGGGDIPRPGQTAPCWLYNLGKEGV